MAYTSQLEQIAGIRSIARTLTGGDAELSITSVGGTPNIGASLSNRVLITGTTTITSFGSVPNIIRFVRFAGILTITHNGTSLVLPTGTNITTAADDIALFTSDASGNWRLISYNKANGQALVGSAGGSVVRQSYTATAGQTSQAVSGGYTAGLIDVYINGSKLVNGDDVIVTSGTSVTFTVPLIVGDAIDIIGSLSAVGSALLSSSIRHSLTPSTEGQTVFTVAGGYAPNALDVYYNGSKLQPVTDVTTSSGSTITLLFPSTLTDVIDVVGVNVLSSIGTVSRQSFVATAGQVDFFISGGYQANSIDVFQNGVKLQNAVDVTVTTGTKVTLITPADLNDIIDVCASQQAGGNGVCNLSTTQNATTVTVVSSTGGSAVLPAATTSKAGVMSALDKSLMVNLDNNGIIELGNGRTTSAISYIDFHSTVPLVDFDARIQRDAGTNGGMYITNTGNGTLGITSQGGSVVIQANNLNTLVAYSNGTVGVERGILSLGRNDSAYEGGQIAFRNALSNDDTLHMDLFGNTATPLFRIFGGIGDLLTIDTSTSNTTIKGKIFQGLTNTTNSSGSINATGSSYAWSPGTSQSSEVGAVANLFYNGGTGNNYSGMFLRYYDTAVVGDTTTVNYTIPKANLGMLLSQNTSNMVIGSNTTGNIYILQGVLGATAIFDTNGYFGVGTNSTLKGKVHVQGHSLFTGAPTATTSKAATLTIIDTLNNPQCGGTIEFGGMGGVTHCAIKGTIGDGTGYSAGEMRFYNRAAVGTSAMAEVMVINNAGNVGIGTSGPSQKLTVQGNIILSAADPKIGLGDINSLWIGNANTSNTLTFNTSGVERMRIDNTGKVTIPGSIISPSACKAWVNFDGEAVTSTGQNKTIRSSHNISSVVDIAAGKNTANFTTAMPNVNYAVVASCARNDDLPSIAGAPISQQTTGNFGIYTTSHAGAYTDTRTVSFVVYAN